MVPDMVPWPTHYPAALVIPGGRWITMTCADPRFLPGWRINSILATSPPFFRRDAMKKIVSMFMAVAVVFGMGLSQSGAAETKPIAALAVASYNDLVSDVNFVGGLVERPQLGAALEGLLAMVTQGKGLAGVDKTRPWGVIVQASGEADFSGLRVRARDRLQASLGPAGTL